jgi:hypothetical protein
MFFPIVSKDGKKALLNLDCLFAFIETAPGQTVALATGGSTFEIPLPIDKIEDMVAELDEIDDD